MSQREVYLALKSIGGRGSVKEIRAQLPSEIRASSNISDRLGHLKKWGLVEHINYGVWKIIGELLEGS
jgi:hypothetical protein